MDRERAIRAESLTKTYRSSGISTSGQGASTSGAVTVFDGLFLDVRRGERLAIVGESGAGKSTLLHLLGGLDYPSSGTVWHYAPQEINIGQLNEQELAGFRNRQLGFVWQNPSLLPEFSALENVMMPLLIRGVEPDLAARMANEGLAEVGLSARASHRAGELSGGEQQRVALARALVTKPRVLLADEPTGSLDYKTSDAIFELLDQVHKAHALTSIFVTHNLAFAARCDRVLELSSKGGLQPFSTPSSKMNMQDPMSEKDATRLNGGHYV